MASNDSSDDSDNDSRPVAYAPDGKLCQHCSKLTNHSFRGKSRACGYGLTAGELRKSRDDCRMCFFIYEALCEPACGEILGDPRRRYVFRLVNERLASDEWPIIALAIDLEDSPGKGHYGPPTRGLRVVPTTGKHKSIRRRESEAEKEQDAKKHLKKRLVRPRFKRGMTDAAWTLAKDWLYGCTTHHRVCRTALSGESIDNRAQKPQLPTRIVHVPADGEPALIESNGKTADYLALSYCWGDGKNMELTKQSLADWQDKLPVDLMPRTIRDAFEAARRLEVEYIWIDRICIAQDDDADWEREAGKMAAIYSNALCTIAALGAESSESGLFVRTDPGPVVRVPYFSLKKGKQKFRGHFELVQMLPFSVHVPPTRPAAGFRMTPKANYPTTGLRQEIQGSLWNTRGWVFQERTLSRRVLYFGKCQIYWECQLAMHSEDGVDRLINDHVPHEKKRQFRQLRHIDNPAWGFATEMGMEKLDQYDSKGIPTAVRRGPPKTRDDKITDRVLRIAADWGNSSLIRNIPSGLSMAMKELKLGPGTFIAGSLDQAKLVRAYSISNLSRDSDKLSAFGGLGEAIAKRVGGQYNSGIWTATLARGLFWYPLKTVDRVCKPWRAPSWSWASWDGQIIGFAENEQQINGTDDTDATDTELWMQGGWNGLLKRENFEAGNKLMERELYAKGLSDDQKPRGVKSVSLRATVMFIDVDQNIKPCRNYKKLWRQMTGLLRTWQPGYSPWPQDECHLLFMEDQCKGNTSMRLPKTSYKCPTCSDVQESHNESAILFHAERCKGKGSELSEQDGQHDKLIGVARFDTPSQPPKSYRAIILWNNSDRAVFDSEGLYHPEQTSSSDDKKHSLNLPAMWGYEEKEMHPLQHSDTTILALERSKGSPNTKQQFPLGFKIEIGGAWYAKVWQRRKRNYFLLLVEPTEWENSYRRVGIGIAYWIPGIQRLGGEKLPDVAKSEKIVLL